jgi:hypothetical protein
MSNSDANGASRAVVAGAYRQMVGAGETTGQIEPLAWMKFGRPFGRPPDPRSARGGSVLVAGW